MSDFGQILALAHQRVLDLGMIRETKRHAGDEGLVRRDAEATGVVARTTGAIGYRGEQRVRRGRGNFPVTP